LTARIKTLLRAVISLGLLSYLVYLANPKQMIVLLTGVWTSGRIIYIFGAVCLFLVAMLIFSLRWYILLQANGINIPVFRLYKYYLMGLFFNNFLPTGIGGDIIRIYNVIRETDDRTISFSSVLTERLIGISGTLLLTLVSLLVLIRQFDNYILIYIDLVLLVCVAIFFTLVFSKRLSDPLTAFFDKIKVFRLGERINKFLGALRFYQNQRLFHIMRIHNIFSL